MNERRGRPKALLFDVQGTATDFMSTICREARRIDADRHGHVDWGVLIERWRAEYFAALKAANGTGGKWVSVSTVYRTSLDALLNDYGLADLSAAERDELSLAWQRLDPWPDVIPGLLRLKPVFTLGALSNADVSAVIRLSKRAGLPWDAIFSAQMCGAFKPEPAVYRMAAAYLGLQPAEIMMVASHKYDIRAAADVGLQTAFVARPLEFGDDAAPDVTYEDEFTINAADFEDLASQLGC